MTPQNEVKAVHPQLEWLLAFNAGRAWLKQLPKLIEVCAEQWGLVVHKPFPYAFASLALPVTQGDGTDAVLKIQFPDRESEHEAAALANWDGDGAVRLIAYDGDRRALLIERCVPGTPLYEIGGDAALDVLIGLLPRLWKPAAAPFTTLSEEADRWLSELPLLWERAGRPFERRLLDSAVDALRSLPGSQGEHVLLHQDLHAANVLRAEREPWLVIDPKPLVGEREFGVVAAVRGGELGDGPSFVRHRFDRLTSELGLDRERVRGWTLAQTLAWGFEGDRVRTYDVECARWLMSTV